MYKAVRIQTVSSRLHFTRAASSLNCLLPRSCLCGCNCHPLHRAERTYLAPFALSHYWTQPLFYASGAIPLRLDHRIRTTTSSRSDPSGCLRPTSYEPRPSARYILPGSVTFGWPSYISSPIPRTPHHPCNWRNTITSRRG
jgi:hypothetical protein